MEYTYTVDEIRANVADWIEALEGGKYQQGHSYLCREGKFCCLGVGADVVSRKYPERIMVKYDSGKISYSGHTGILVEKTRAPLGISSQFGRFDSDDLGSLVSLNEHGKSFKEIASVIRSNPPQLFIDGIFNSEHPPGSR